MIVEALVANESIDSSELAYVLFPQNIHPKRALSRLCNDLTNQVHKNIKEDQIKRLAVYLGVNISELFGDVSKWSTFQRQNAISFKKGDKFIMIDLKSNTGYVFKSNQAPVFFRLGLDNELLKAIHQIETKF